MSQDNSIIWRPAPGYETRFLVSNTGLIRSLKSVTGSGKLRKLQMSNKGYPQLGIMVPDGKGGLKTRQVLVHRLVAKAFVPNPDNKPQVNHKDSNRTNCNALNLEWSTQAENIQHGVKHGYVSVGQEQGNSRLTNTEVRRIRKELKVEPSNESIAKKYGVSRTAIYLIRVGKNWKYLT